MLCPVCTYIAVTVPVMSAVCMVHVLCSSSYWRDFAPLYCVTATATVIVTVFVNCMS